MSPKIDLEIHKNGYILTSNCKFSSRLGTSFPDPHGLLEHPRVGFSKLSLLWLPSPHSCVRDCPFTINMLKGSKLHVNVILSFF